MGTGLAPKDKAKKDNAYQMAEVGFFNDTSRDAIKGAEVLALSNEAMSVGSLQKTSLRGQFWEVQSWEPS